MRALVLALGFGVCLSITPDEQLRLRSLDELGGVPYVVASAWPACKNHTWSRLALSVLGAKEGSSMGHLSGYTPQCPDAIGFHCNAQGPVSGLVPSEIFFLTHGYTDASNSSWMEKLQDRLLLRQGARVLRCGWSKGAGILHMPYSQAPANIYSNGFNIAVTMQREYEAAPFATLTCIGHSLGAHSCGMAGKMFALGATEQAAGSPLRKKLLDRIIALDPAGPTFDDALSSPVDNPTRRWRITPSDAAFVFGLHTDAINTGIMAFGTAHPVGHLDVYVTPGALQPLCRRDPWFNVVRRLSCSHSAAIWYLIDSLVSGPGGYASKHWCAGTPVPFAPTRVTPVPKFPPCNGAADNTAALQWGIDAEAPPAQGASRIVVIPAADVPSSAHAVIDTQRY